MERIKVFPRRVKVLIQKTMRPSGCKKMFRGEEYMLPRELADKIVRMKRGEIVFDDYRERTNEPSSDPEPDSHQP